MEKHLEWPASWAKADASTLFEPWPTVEVRRGKLHSTFLGRWGGYDVQTFRGGRGDIGIAVHPHAGFLPRRYRSAAADLERGKRYVPNDLALGELRTCFHMAAHALADDVVARADATVSADASWAGHMRTLIGGAIYTLGNPMSGLGGNMTVQAALEALREAEALLDREPT